MDRPSFHIPFHGIQSHGIGSIPWIPWNGSMEWNMEPISIVGVRHEQDFFVRVRENRYVFNPFVVMATCIAID